MKVPVVSKNRRIHDSSLKPPVKRLVQKNSGLRKLSSTEVDIILSTPLSTVIKEIEEEVKNDNNNISLETIDEKTIPDLTMEDLVESLVLYILFDGDDTQFNDPTDKKQRDIFNGFVRNFQKNKTEVMNEYRPVFKKIMEEQLDSFAQFARCIEVFKLGISKVDTTSKPILREQMEDARYVAKINNDQQRQEATQQFDSKWKWDLAKYAGTIFLSTVAFSVLGFYGNAFGHVIIEHLLNPSLSYIGSFLPYFRRPIIKEEIDPIVGKKAAEAALKAFRIFPFSF